VNRLDTPLPAGGRLSGTALARGAMGPFEQATWPDPYTSTI